MLATIVTNNSVGHNYMRLTHSRGANAVKKLLSYGFGHTPIRSESLYSPWCSKLAQQIPC